MQGHPIGEELVAVRRQGLFRFDNRRSPNDRWIAYSPNFCYPFNVVQMRFFQCHRSALRDISHSKLG